MVPLPPPPAAPGIDDEVTTELEGVLGRKAWPLPTAENSGVGPHAAQPPHAPPRASSQAIGAVGRATLVGQHGVEQPEAVTKAAQVSWPREGDQYHGSIAELGETIAHGDRMLMTRQSGQMTVEDHDDSPTVLLREPPPAALIVGQVNFRRGFARLNLNGHSGSFRGCELRSCRWGVGGQGADVEIAHGPGPGVDHA